MTIVNDSIIKQYDFFANESLSSIVIGTNVKLIERGAFFNCLNLKLIIFMSDDLIKLGSNAFYKCLGLSELQLPDSILYIDEECFHRCYNLKSIYLPNKLKTIKYLAFDNCISLEDVVIPDNVETILFGAFLHCKKLNNVVMSSKTYNRIRNDIDKIFYDSPNYKLKIH